MRGEGIRVFDCRINRTLVAPELFEVIKTIITSKMVRRQMEWYFEFISDNEGKLVQKHTSKYTMHNVSHDAAENPVKILIDHKAGEVTRLLSAKCIMHGQETVNYSHEQDENPNVRIENKGTITSYEYIVTIPAGESVEMIQVLETRADEDTIHDAWFTRHPLIDGFLMATFPEDYDFSVFPTMSSELKPQIIEPTRRTFVLKGGVLPGQGYVYSLEKKKELADKCHCETTNK